jgi:D-lactate dehydrogenase
MLLCAVSCCDFFHTYLCLLQGIGMRVLAYDIVPNPKVQEMDIPYMSIEEILPQADVVSLHVPLLPSTYEIMNKPRCVG